jgi:hypothetical protein
MKHQKTITKVLVGLLAILLILSAVPFKAFGATIQDMSGKTIEIKEFSDTKGHWAQKIINKWQYYDILSGIGGNKFNPNGKVLRRDFAVILDRLLEYKATAINSFADVELGQYYTSAILKLNAAGVIPSDTKYFRPHTNITREEAAVMLCKAFKIEPSTDKLQFKDANLVSKAAYPYIAAMEKLKYISGSYGRFNPKSTLTRAEAITIIDSMVTAMYTESGEYKNNYTGNGLITTGNITITNSNIKGNIYVGPAVRSGELRINSTNINGTLMIMSANAKLTLSGATRISELQLRGDNTKITNGQYIAKLVVGPESTESTMTGMPQLMVIKPGGGITIDKAKFTNDTYYDLTYNQGALIKQVADQQGSVAGGPEVLVKEAAINMDNTVTLNRISVKSDGDSAVYETGVIYNRNNSYPTVDAYVGKQVFAGNKADYSSYNLKICTQNTDEVWTYRAYAINRNGKIGYSEPIQVRSFSYNINSYLTGSRNIYNSDNKVTAIEKTFQVSVYGTNIPEISNVTVLGSQVNGADDEYRETKAQLIDSTDSAGLKRMQYVATIKYSADRTGSISTDTYYGYRIVFGNSRGTKESFPSYVVGISSNTEIQNVYTGTASYNSPTQININGNDFTTGVGEIIETGVMLLEANSNTSAPTSVNSSNSWQKYSSYTGYGELKHNYNMTISVNAAADKVYYYAAFARTANATVYGSIKKLGSPDMPIYNGIRSVTLSNNKTTATVVLNVSSNLGLDLTKQGTLLYMINVNKDKGVGQYTGKSLSDANATFTNGTLTLTFNNLDADNEYTVGFNITNVMGTVTKADIRFNTTNNY